MPVPGPRFPGKIVFFVEVDLDHAQQGHQEEDSADRHVGTVEAGEHEERRAVDPRFQRQVQMLVGLEVLLRLKNRNVPPRATVASSQAVARQRWASFMAWWATVSVQLLVSRIAESSIGLLNDRGRKLEW